MEKYLLLSYACYRVWRLLGNVCLRYNANTIWIVITIFIEHQLGVRQNSILISFPWATTDTTAWGRPHGHQVGHMFNSPMTPPQGGRGLRTCWMWPGAQGPRTVSAGTGRAPTGCKSWLPAQPLWPPRAGELGARFAARWDMRACSPRGLCWTVGRWAAAFSLVFGWSWVVIA